MMWKKFDMDFKIDCDSECGFAPLPEFNIPPPPLPPFLKEITKCSETSAADYEMCSLIPVSFITQLNIILSLYIFLSSCALLIVMTFFREHNFFLFFTLSLTILSEHDFFHSEQQVRIKIISA